MFLANGSEIRVQSAKFHRKIKQAITLFSENVGLNKKEVRVCDHQHLTYDLFAKDKGVEGSQVHKFRSITNRYLAEEQNIPANADALTYAVVDFPLNRRIRSLIKTDDNEHGCYNELYNLIADDEISCSRDSSQFLDST